MSETDGLIARWLETTANKGTRALYLYGITAYLEFVELSPTDLIDEAVEDARRDPRKKQGYPRTRLIKFYEWLKTEYPRRGHAEGQVGLSETLSYVLVNAVRSWYASFEIYVKLKGRSALKKPRPENKRQILNAGQVRKLMSCARSMRDRALIIMPFQSGLDVSTMCSLNYIDIKDGLDRDYHKLDVVRVKTDVSYYTFIGKDSIDALNVYLRDVKTDFKDDTPLFMTTRGVNSHTRLAPNNVQSLMRDVAVRAGFIEADAKYNTAGAHALRESFSSIMTNKNVPNSIVDFWLGHEIGTMSEAYMSVQYSDLEKTYLEREKFVSIYRDLWE